MEFDEFVRQVDAAVRDTVSVDDFQAPAGNKAAWKTRAHGAVMEAAAPRNVSLTLVGAHDQPVTWYPIDAALVQTVSRRIAGYLAQ